nr:HD domain-containing phosphohydrolase [Thiorhodococcus mannitoliphagus]
MKNQDEGSYNHAINVVALAMVVGQKLELDKPELRLLGLGALFHDLGHLKIPSQILLKKGVLTQPERQFLAQHPRYGADLARQIKTLPAAVVEIIARHHEHLDGSGYPEGLGAKDIGTLTRIVTVVNRYDNLCNGFTVDHPLSPHQAISQMYSKEREQYDPKVMTTFITNLGVYPPGTIVRLKDERVAVVVSINADDLLKPNVLVYAPEIPSTEALVLDLAEEGVAISESLRRSDLTAEQIEYLNLSDKLTYYFQSPKASPRR